jgi:hypothetical protein
MTVSTEARAATTRVSVPQMAQRLQELLGQKLTAFIVGVADPKEVGQWAREERAPEPALIAHLGTAYEVASRLRQVESAAAVQAWFVGMNPDLDDRAPAEVIAQDPALVQEAADIFLAAG